MPQIKENFFENILFNFRSLACDCVEDTIHVVPGKAPNRPLKLQSLKDKPILFGYVAKKGLVRIGSNGAIEEENILGKLVALSSKPNRDLVNFFSRNGFLFPISDTSYESINTEDLKTIINRLKTTIDLMTAINEIKKDYNKVAELIVQLLFADAYSLKTNAMETEYHTCVHPYPFLLDNPPPLTREHEQEGFDGNMFKINDSIFGTFLLPISDYNDMCEGSFDSSFANMSGLAQLYVNFENSSDNRLITEFLFHCYYKCTPQTAIFNQAMKEAAVKVAKLVIAEELNSNLGDIKLVYDADKMKPTWQISSLFCAAYLAIFYLDPELELLKPCENPRCQNYFLVRATTTKVKYCCTECCNRVTQERYRKHKRERESNKGE